MLPELSPQCSVQFGWQIHLVVSVIGILINTVDQEPIHGKIVSHDIIHNYY